MNTNDVLTKLKSEIERLSAEHSSRYGMDEAAIVLDELEDFVTSLQQEQPETEMKSPFTGGNVVILSRQEEVIFRGEKVKILRKYYRCEDTGKEFTNDKLDDDMMWATFRAYCEKKGITSFTDIMLKQEQSKMDLEEEINGYWIGLGMENYIEKDKLQTIARHFYELGRSRKQ